MRKVITVAKDPRANNCRTEAGSSSLQKINGTAIMEEGM
jgi:hypothetical protein